MGEITAQYAGIAPNDPKLEPYFALAEELDMQTHRTWFRAITPTLLAAVAAGGLMALAAPAQAESDEAGSGLLAGDAAWSRWQGRFGLSSQPGPALSSTGRRADAGPGGAPLQSLSLLGDYYFLQHDSAPASRYGGGFRATGGVILGARSTPWSLLPGSLSALGSGFGTERRSFALWSPAPSESSEISNGSVPYVGVGYTGLKTLTATGGGWGFSADVGLMALRPRSAVRLGQQNVGDTLRDLQLSPLLQLGVSYSF